MYRPSKITTVLYVCISITYVQCKQLIRLITFYIGYKCTLIIIIINLSFKLFIKCIILLAIKTAKSVVYQKGFREVVFSTPWLKCKMF